LKVVSSKGRGKTNRTKAIGQIVVRTAPNKSESMGSRTPIQKKKRCGRD